VPRLRVQKPDDLGEHGSKFWDFAVKALPKDLKSVDYAALRLACRWLDRSEKGLSSDAKGSDVTAGIATDKFLDISKRFGFTPKDRKESGIGGGTKPKAEQKKTALDDLKPENLGAKRVDRHAD